MLVVYGKRYLLKDIIFVHYVSPTFTPLVEGKPKGMSVRPTKILQIIQNKRMIEGGITVNN